MSALGRCGFRGILYRTLHANRPLGPALSGPTSSCRIEAPCILYQNGNTVVTATTAHRRLFSAGRWHNAKRIRPPSIKHARYKWVSSPVSDDLYDALEPYILDSSRRASERFPVTPSGLEPDAQKGIPNTLNPHNPENQAPPSPPDPAPDPDPDLDLDPDGPQPRKTYRALAIDCEMVTMKGCEQGLLNIAVVDFFTGKAVLRSLVRPEHPVTDWRKSVTGFNKSMLSEAAKKGKVLSGWGEVRERIFDVTTSETIFIGHALANDLRVLRIASDRVIDSMLMMSRAVFGDAKTFPRHWGLKAACQEFLDVTVQKTRGPHNPLEDALATRELVLQCVLFPEKLAEWGASTHANLEQVVQREQAKLEAKLEKKRLKKAARDNMTPEQLALEAAEKARVKEEKRNAKQAKREAEVLRKHRKLFEKKERRYRSRGNLSFRKSLIGEVSIP
ncbi:ribonuclease H-like domain-containing protein [Nemania abortiva]|nr:ribonuclease H-like domain-containing protein [Nemania abortiva]